MLVPLGLVQNRTLSAPPSVTGSIRLLFSPVRARGTAGRSRGSDGQQTDLITEAPKVEETQDRFKQRPTGPRCLPGLCFLFSYKNLTSNALSGAGLAPPPWSTLFNNTKHNTETSQERAFPAPRAPLSHQNIGHQCIYGLIDDHFSRLLT